MAATLTGTPVAVTWASGANPAGQSITIPSDATAVYMFWAYYNGADNHGLLSATLNSVSPDETFEAPTAPADETATGVAAWYNPSTGSQTLDVEWDAAPGEGPITIVAFVKDGDTTGWRDADAANEDSATAVTVTLTTVSGDLVIKLDQRFSTTTAPSLSSGWTSAQTQINRVSESARLSYISATGTTQVCDSEDENYSSVAAIAIGPAASASHATTGSLSAQSASVAGSATHLTLHATTGALASQSASVAGSSVHLTLHETTGALAAQSATVAGTAVHPHITTGALAADAATVAGSATRSDATGSHSTTGSLSAQDAAVTGSATHLTLHATTGALSADAAAVSGSAAHLTLHTTTGALASGTATVSGAATNTPAALGAIARPAADTTAGAWLPSAGSDLFAMLDEETPDDSDYIRATTATTCEISLSEVADPGTSTGQAFSYRVWSPEGNGVIVRLKQGVTTIATWTHDTLPTAATTYVRNLTASECDAITDYAALSVEFESTV